MKKKGFTLIELLAVIVVLAIIALIATPIVMNTIKKAKQGAAERSADNYIGAVETAIATAKLDSDGVPDGTYTIDENGNLLVPSLPDGKLTIEMNGNKPTGGTITIKNGQVTTDSAMTIGDYEVVYNPTSKDYEAKEPYNGVLCKANTSKVSALVWSSGGDPSKEASYKSEEVGLLASEATSAYDVGVTYTCELGDGKQNTFYVLETNGDNVSLIAGMNLGGTVAWSDDKNNHKDESETSQAVTAKAILRERTSSWTKLKRSQIVLPSGQQIATAGGDTKWSNSNTGSGFSSAKWLYSYIEFTEGTIGYWTSAYDANNNSNAWCVTFSGGFTNGNVGDSIYFGVRPVINISKSQLG